MRIDYSIDHPVRLEVNFEVEGFTILLGQSGEGKTTLLRAIAGLLPAQGEPFGGLLPQHRAVGYLPQGYALFPHLRAWENVAFGLPRGRQRRAQALELLARVQLVDVAEHYPSTLSGGPQQRGAVGGRQRHHFASAAAVRASGGSAGAVDDRPNGGATTIVGIRSAPHGQSGYRPSRIAAQSGCALSSGVAMRHRAAVAVRPEQSGAAYRPGNRARNHGRFTQRRSVVLAAPGLSWVLNFVFWLRPAGTLAAGSAQNKWKLSSPLPPTALANLIGRLHR